MGHPSDRSGSAQVRSVDVCVIGGGPAGSTMAHRLASLGHHACVIEREAFPRPRVAASLPATVLPLLDVIGVRDQVETATFLRPEQIIVWWSTACPVIRPLPSPGFHVDRRVFDRLLLGNAQENGVVVLQPAQAFKPERSENGWKITVRCGGNMQEIAARFLVDASGVRKCLPGRRPRLSAPLLALYAEWIGKDLALEGRVEAGQDAWFWYAPISPRRSVAAVFLDPKRLSGRPNMSMAAVYHEALMQFRLLPRGKDFRLAGPVAACNASSRYTDSPAGSDFLRVGDACLVLDPLSSQGIQTAIASALQGAVVVNTLLRRPGDAAAIRFYCERQEERARRHAAKAASFYREMSTVHDSAFWHERAAYGPDPRPVELETQTLDPACRIALSASAEFRDVAVIQGDLIGSATALSHPSLESPVAFVRQIPLAPLLQQIAANRSALSTVELWSRTVPADLSWELLTWLWRRRIVIPAASSAIPALRILDQ